MKKITIKGKHNNDMLNRTEKKALRININYEEPDHTEQVKLINKCYMDLEDDALIYVKRELDKKISSYRSQDNKKNIVCNLITYEELIEKLVISRLLCNYCRKTVKILFKEVRDKEQWTLDRIDNDLGHTNDNTVVCCLKCNLERRCLDAKKFEFTKQLKIKKAEG